jgi:hypothetical protein
VGLCQIAERREIRRCIIGLVGVSPKIRRVAGVMARSTFLMSRMSAKENERPKLV